MRAGVSVILSLFLLYIIIIYYIINVLNIELFVYLHFLSYVCTVFFLLTGPNRYIVFIATKGHLVLDNVQILSMCVSSVRLSVRHSNCSDITARAFNHSGQIIRFHSQV